MEAVNYSDKEFEQILREIEKMMEEAEQSPLPQVKEMVTSILQYFEMMHKEPLARLLKIIEKDHTGLRSKIEEDYTINTLFTLYDLIEGNIERSPMDNPGTKGFIPVEEVGLLSSVSKLDGK
jgi:hypothetical protein